jgi:2'-5' RNA ligase
LSAPVVAAIVAWQQRELTAGRVVPPESLHFTLAFLGHRPADEVPAIARELRAAAAAAADVQLEPRRYRETRSVGMLVFDDLGGAGTALAADLGERLERLGIYTREPRPWLPHVTVVRFRTRPRLGPSVPELGRISPSDAAVYSSVPRPGGARYDVLESVALGGR